MFVARRTAVNSVLTTAKRFEGAFIPRPTKPLPVGVDVVHLTPQRIRPAHWTEAELNALPKPVANPNLDKNKFAFLAPIVIPGAFAWGFYIINNATGIYNDRQSHLRPY